MNDERRLLVLAEGYAAARGVSLATVSTYALGSGAALRRVTRGCGITTRRIGRAIQWFSDHWPTDALWPPDIPRPAPAAPPEAPVPEAPAPPPAPPREATAAARERKLAAMDAGDWDAAKRHEHAMLKAALVLDDRGQIADPGALCLALNVPRYIYDDVVRRYAGHPERRPRPTTRTARMVRSLRLSGDRRFTAAPRPREAA